MTHLLCFLAFIEYSLREHEHFTKNFGSTHYIFLIEIWTNLTYDLFLFCGIVGLSFFYQEIIFSIGHIW